jgi:ubiquinone/menaquinone biosynthesis C-methylase UbiE
VNIPEYERIYSFEKDYWWHVARRHLVRRYTEHFTDKLKDANSRYLDLGCGTGVLMSEVGETFHKPIGIDLSSTALSFTKSRVDYPLSQSDARHLPFADDTFDLITCLDIIEHVREDLDCLREMYRICKPGGHLVLSVPALDFLWSEHDEAVFHLRRYSWPSLKGKVSSVGFRVMKGTYATMVMLLPVYAIRLVSAFTRKHIEAEGHDFPRLPGWANHLLIQWHALETAISLRIGLPMGTGLVCIVQKPHEAGAE